MATAPQPTEKKTEHETKKRKQSDTEIKEKKKIAKTKVTNHAMQTKTKIPQRFKRIWVCCICHIHKEPSEGPADGTQGALYQWESFWQRRQVGDEEQVLVEWTNVIYFCLLDSVRVGKRGNLLLRSQLMTSTRIGDQT